MPWPVPTLEQLAQFAGRPAVSYTSYVDSALLQATIMFTVLAERSADDYASMAPDDQTLANLGVMAMADWIYLRHPYQQVLASPLQSESIGSYEYNKPVQEMARNAQAIEVTAEKTGVDMFDLAVRVLAKRSKLAGVYSGQITGFEILARDDLTQIRFNEEKGRWELLGPADRDQVDLQFFSVNAEMFPADPS